MVVNAVDPHKSSIGNLDANVMAMLVYISAALIGWIPGVRYVAWLVPLIIYFVEKNSSFVKFHAIQALILNAIWQVIAFIIFVIFGGIAAAVWKGGLVVASALAAGAITLVGSLVSLAFCIFAAIAIYQAYFYKTYRIPVVGQLADKLIAKLGA